MRKYFFGSQVKHNDKDVATAASALRSRWVATLGKGAPAPAPTPASTSASASGASSADGKRESAEESSRSHHNDRKFEASSAGAGPRGAAGGAIGRYAKHRENGRQGVKMKMKKGVGSKEDGKVGVKSEVVTATPSVTDDASPGGAVKKEAPQQAALDEVRGRLLCIALLYLTKPLAFPSLALVYLDGFVTLCWRNGIRYRIYCIYYIYTNIDMRDCDGLR